MRNGKLSTGLAAALGAIAVTLFAVSAAPAQTEAVIHSFRNNGIDGTAPMSGLILDASGNLYGTTSAGGIYGGGTVFEFSHTTGGAWTEKIIHNFNNNGVDGYAPGAGLTLDPAGNLWGTTLSGGTFGGGVIFRLSPRPGGIWGEKIMANFFEEAGGGPVTSSMLLDAAGNFYGTTQLGGSNSSGMVFELKALGGGNYTLLTLHSFPTAADDGCFPLAGVTLDGAGNLYGTTPNCGTDGEGVVYKLSPQSDGTWSEAILYNFGDSVPNNGQPFSTVAFDASGNLFTTSGQGGTDIVGSVIELTPVSGGVWNESIIFSFDAEDGYNPHGPLLIDSSGEIYGTAQNGLGGVVYELTPGVGGIWTQTILYSFSGPDGNNPLTGVIRDSSGNIYGTTTYGGADSSCVPFGCGVVFEIRP